MIALDVWADGKVVDFVHIALFASNVTSTNYL